jgi:hypothetical protein
VTALDDGDMERSGRGGPGASAIARQFDGLRLPRVPESDDEQPAGRVTVADGATTRAGGCEQLRDGPDSPHEVVDACREATRVERAASREHALGRRPGEVGTTRDDGRDGWVEPRMPSPGPAGSSGTCSTAVGVERSTRRPGRHARPVGRRAVGRTPGLCEPLSRGSSSRLSACKPSGRFINRRSVMRATHRRALSPMRSVGRWRRGTPARVPPASAVIKAGQSRI